jgi:hypothetical protein
MLCKHQQVSYDDFVRYVRGDYGRPSPECRSPKYSASPECRSYKNRQIGSKGCLGRSLGRNSVTNVFLSGYLGPFRPEKQPERAKGATKKPIGNQSLAQKAPQTRLEPHLAVLMTGDSMKTWSTKTLSRKSITGCL